MLVHSNSKTTPKIRAEFRRADWSIRQLARHYGVSVSTVHRWRHRKSVLDRSSRPKNPRRAFEQGCEALALKLRAWGLELDECLDLVREHYPKASRSSLHRLFVRQGVGRLQAKSKREKKKFRNYTPGFVHIDTFNMPKIGGKKRYCFLAVDRATRLLFLKVFDNKSKRSSEGFLKAATDFFPFKIHRILTDNGSEYTNHYYKGGRPCKKHPFDALCEQLGIFHKLTAVRTPQTNGMAERMVQMVKKKALQPLRFDSHASMEQAVCWWAVTYNHFRKHGSLKRRTPLEVACQWYNEKPEIFTRNPNTIKPVFATC